MKDNHIICKMNYPPKHHQEANFKNCVFLAQEYPLATMISNYEGNLCTTHLPLVYQKNDSLGKFIGHIDKMNPQLKAIKNGSHLELIFHGPETYISPSIYHSTQLPTWNYFKAHFKGIPTLTENHKKVKQSLIAMTTILEGSTPAYTLEEDNPRMAAALAHIVGFEITIDSWEGKHKISQDKHQRDQKEAHEALLKKYPKQQSIIDQLYEQHQTKKH